MQLIQQQIIDPLNVNNKVTATRLELATIYFVNELLTI